MYFLKLCETTDVSLNDFSKWRKNDKYVDFFEKANMCKISFGNKKIGDTNRQRNKVYAHFMKAVSGINMCII